jgi:hypothetical protein
MRRNSTVSLVALSVISVATIGALVYLATEPRPFWLASTNLEVVRVQRITIGATDKEVIKAIGEPLIKNSPDSSGRTGWLYEDRGKGRSLMVFFQNERVIGLSLREEEPFRIIWQRP